MVGVVDFLARVLLYDWVVSFLPGPTRRRPRPYKAHSDQWQEFKYFILYPALVIELFFCSSFMHRPLFVAVYVLPPLLGILWAVGFIADDTLVRCTLRLRTLFYLLVRGNPFAVFFILFGGLLFVSFFLLWGLADKSLWFFSFVFILGFWFRLVDLLIFRCLRRR